MYWCCFASDCDLTHHHSQTYLPRQSAAGAATSDSPFTEPGDETGKEAFAQGKASVLIGTHALATGLDAPGVTTIIHCGSPFSLLNLVQGIGRAARETGAIGHAYLLAQRDPSRTLSLEQQEVETYAKSTTCLYEQLSSFVDGVTRCCSTLAWEVQCAACSQDRIRLAGTGTSDRAEGEDAEMLMMLAEQTATCLPSTQMRPFETARSRTSTCIAPPTLSLPATARWTSDPAALAQSIRNSLYKATSTACLRCWYRAEEGFDLHPTTRCPLFANGNPTAISAQLQSMQYTDADRCGTTTRVTCRRCGHPLSTCKLMHRGRPKCEDEWAIDDPKLKMLGVVLHEIQRGEDRLAAIMEEAHQSCFLVSPSSEPSGPLQDIEFMRDHPFEVYRKPFTFQSWLEPARSTVFAAQSRLYTLCSWLLWAFIHARSSDKSSQPTSSNSPKTPATARTRQISSSSDWTASTPCQSQPFTVMSSSPAPTISSSTPRLPPYVTRPAAQQSSNSHTLASPFAPSTPMRPPSSILASPAFLAAAVPIDPPQNAPQRKAKVLKAFEALRQCCGSCFISTSDFKHDIQQCPRRDSAAFGSFISRADMGRYAACFRCYLPQNYCQPARPSSAFCSELQASTLIKAMIFELVVHSKDTVVLAARLGVTLPATTPSEFQSGVVHAWLAKVGNVYAIWPVIEHLLLHR